MIRIAISEDILSELQMQKQILQHVMETRFNFCEGYTFSYHKKQYNIPLMQIRFFQSDKRVIHVDTIHKSPLTSEY